jgi:hypothetical protein
MLKKMGELPNLLPMHPPNKLRVKVLIKKGECHERHIICSASNHPSSGHPLWVDPIVWRVDSTA